MVNEAEARRRGAEGEARVSQELARLSRRFEFEYIDDVYLAIAGHTTQIDHVLVDRFGFLIIETKVRDALLKGSHNAKKWTACYKSGMKKSFPNPLDQNRVHEDFLRQAVQAHGFDVSPDYVKSAVVFVGARIDTLDLDATSSARVVDVSGIAGLLESRHAFALNPGEWDAQIRERAMSALRDADESANPVARRAHAEYHGYDTAIRVPTGLGMPAGVSYSSARPAAPARGVSLEWPDEALSREARSASTNEPWDFAASPQTSYRAASSFGVDLNPGSPARRRVSPWVAMAVVLGACGAGLALWAVLSILNGTAPPWLWLVIFLLVAAFGGETRTRSRRRRSVNYSHSGARRGETFGEWLTRLALVLAILAVFGWFLFGGGLLWLFEATGGLGFSTTPSAEAISAPTPSGPTLGQAQLALTESAPDIAAKVTNITSPQVTANPPYTVFTWEYIEQPDAASARVHNISLSLDAQGEVWGVDIQ